MYSWQQINLAAESKLQHAGILLSNTSIDYTYMLVGFETFLTFDSSKKKLTSMYFFSIKVVGFS